MFSKIKDKILNRSSSYNYYKDECERLSKNEEKLNNENNKLKKDLAKANNQYHDSKFSLNFDDFLINSYFNPFLKAPFPEKLNDYLNFMEDVSNHLISNLNNVNEIPLVSVIMPVYNRKDIVMNSIESVLSQTYENFELIIVDDGSSDGTVELLKSLNHERIKLILSDENGGSSKARNKGLKVAKGEYITYLDSDNIWDEDYISSTVGAFLELPDAIAIYSAQARYTTYDSEMSELLFASLNKNLLHNANFIDLNSFAHKKCVLEEGIFFDETLFREVDWDFILRIFDSCKVYSVPFLKTRYYYDVTENRISDTIERKSIAIYEKNLNLKTGAKGNLNKKVNVIIPIHESDCNIDKCVNSILSLNLDNFKIILSGNTSDIKLDKFKNQDNVKIIETKLGAGFGDAINQAVSIADDYADLLILSPKAIVSEGSIESLQKYAYELNDCGAVISAQMIKDYNCLKKHSPYSYRARWSDITPSAFYKNIHHIPIFHSGEVLELNYTTFFCTYIKRDVFNSSCCFNAKTKDGFEAMQHFSQYIRLVLGLKIYYVNDVKVIQQ